MREVERAASSTIRRRLAALSRCSGTSSSWRRGAQSGARGERPAINRQEGATLAFSKGQARKLLDLAGRRYDRRLARSRDPLGRPAGRVTPCRDRRAQGRRPAPEPRLQLAAGDAQGRSARCAGDQSADRSAATRLSRARRPRHRQRREQCSGRYGTTASDATNVRQWTRRDRSRGPQIFERTRARSRLLGALDARHLHHHGAGKRRAARRRAEGRGHRDPSTTKLYDRRGYNPEKAASFFATY